MLKYFRYRQWSWELPRERETKESSRMLQTGAMLVAASKTFRKETALRFHGRRGSKAEVYVWDLWL